MSSSSSGDSRSSSSSTRPTSVARVPAGRRRQVILHHQLPLEVAARDELVQLEREQPPVGTQLDLVALDLTRDAPDHLQPLGHHGHVARGRQVLDLVRGQRPRHLIQPELVPLQRGQGLVGPGQDRGRILQHVPGPVQVQGDDPHGLADRDHRAAGLPADPLRGPVPGARFVGRQRGVGDQVHGRPDDVLCPAVEHDGAVHLGQLTQPGRRERHPQLETAASTLRPRRARRRARSARPCSRARCAPARRGAWCPGPGPPGRPSGARPCS